MEAKDMAATKAEKDMAAKDAEETKAGEKEKARTLFMRLTPWQVLKINPKLIGMKAADMDPNGAKTSGEDLNGQMMDTITA